MPLYVATLRVGAEGLADLLAYEAAVLPLLADHGGALERRLRALDGLTEVHVLRFASDADFAAYRADPLRAAAAALFTRSGATAELLEVTE